MTGDSERLKRIYNRPGLSQLAYRIGDYASFRQRLLAALPQALQPPVGSKGESPLAKLTTRDEADPAIALLDAWAVVADVLTFYQERIANEGFLRTATERRSVLELARAIGYELAPGVAASAYLSFKVEDAPGSPTVVPIPERTQIMSVPAKDELPQIFETTEDFTAYLEWNGLRLRPNRPQQIYADTHQLYLSGTSTQLQPGDLLLLVDNSLERQEFLLLLQTVTINTDAGYTLVQWNQSLPTITTPLRRPQLFTFRQQARLFGYNAPDWEIMPAEVKLTAVEKSGKAIQGGVFCSDSDGLFWTPASKGLPNSDILSLAVRDKLLLAGTPDKGVFRSTDNGNSWEAANEGITSMNVLALHIADKDTVFNEAIFAGTPNGGVFRSKDRGKNWVAINTGTLQTRRIDNLDEWEPINTSLPNTLVRSLLTYTASTNLGTGTIYSEGIEVRGENTAFTSELNIGDVITALGQDRIVEAIHSNTSLTIDRAFEIASLPSGTPFSATATITYTYTNQTGNSVTDTTTASINDGTLYSFGNLVRSEDFEQLLDESIRNLNNLNILSGSVTITVERQVMVQGQITSDIQTKTITINSIISDTLTTPTPFTRNNLDSGTSFLLSNPITGNFIFVGTDEGIYRSQDLGRNWLSRNLDERTIYSLLHTTGNNVFAGTDTGVFHSDDDGETWDTAKIPTLQVFATAHHNTFIFVGTDSGIFRSANNGQTWNDINAVQENNGVVIPNSLDKEIRSLTTYERGGTRYLFAATNDGIFVSKNSGEVSPTDVFWQRISQDLATQNVTVIAADTTTNNLFAGTQFSGFLPAESAAATSSNEEATSQQIEPQKLEWPNFTIQDPRQLDLDTLYPQILPKSWIVIVDDRNPQDPERQTEPRYAVRQVETVANVDRRDFGLSGKITRLEPNQAIDPNQFGLRSAVVYNRSTELPLAPEPLTVSDRQHDIFADPLKGDTVYLRDFVNNLQSNQVLIVSGQHLQMKLSDMGGVLRSRYDWTDLNTGLTDLTINALIAEQNGNLLIATNDGLYRSADDGQTWTPFDIFRLKTVHSLLMTESRLLVGADLNLYQLVVDNNAEDLWTKLAIPAEASILSILAYTIVLGATEHMIGPPSGITITVTSGVNIAQTFPVGTLITTLSTEAAEQTRIVTAISDSDQLIINATFNSEQPDPTRFQIGGTVLLVGTDRGFFRSLDKGQTWEYLQSLQALQINALLYSDSGSDHEIYAGTNQGLYHSEDTGQSWEQLEVSPTQQDLAIHALEEINGTLFVGTKRGLYYQDSNSWEQTPGLRDRAVLSLTSENTILYAGTDQGIYRSDDQGQTWNAWDAGLKANTGRALLLYGEQLLVGTEQGLFATAKIGQRSEPVHWNRSNTGIVNSQVISLANSQDGTIILAGTTKGLYRSTSGGRTWEPWDEGLEQTNGPDKLRIQVVLAESRSDREDRWFVGTPEGVFVYGTTEENPEIYRWQPLGRATLPYQNIRALEKQDNWLLAGTIDGGILKLDTNALNQLLPEDELRQQPWLPTGLNNTDVQAIAVNNSRFYAGTIRDGIFRSLDGSNTWQQITSIRTGRGTLISDGNQVTWSGTNFNSLLKVGDIINAAGQSRAILSIEEQGQQVKLTVEAPFRPNLSSNTEFTINTGLTNRDITDLKLVEDNRVPFPQEGIELTLTQNNKIITLTVSNSGDDNAIEMLKPFAASLIPGRVIRANAECRVVVEVTLVKDNQRRVISISLELDRPLSPNVSGNRHYTLSHFVLYAGTAGSGVFRSIEGNEAELAGDRWQQVIANLEDLDIRCLTCEDNGTLWVGTATQGVFRSDNQGDLWATANLNLTNTDIQAISIPTKSTLIVGGIGFLRSEDNLTVQPAQRHDLVQVIQPPQLVSVTQPLLKQPTRYQDWLVRDKNEFQGTLRTSVEQQFPLLPAAKDAPQVSEEVRVKHPPTDQQRSVLTLQTNLRHSYDPTTVEIAANVVPATHGETITEILGSGDGNITNQHFVLKKPPLTYISAANDSGAESTLEVRVDAVLWQEVSSLYSLQPQEQAYIVRIEDDEATTVTFGDGHRGARLPSGKENITTRYRSGIGTDGNVAARQLNILKTRPQGIAEVTNPKTATGGANKESLEAARTNAPPTARTLGRIVSLRDFQDFAQGFAGIGKAQAQALWDGNAQVVHITIAGADGAEIPETSALYTSLVEAIEQARDPIQQVQIASYERLFFKVEARILLDARYLADTVEPEIVNSLLSTFAFERRDFGQPVTSAEIIAAIQTVEGVTAVDLDALYVVGRSRALNASLNALIARYDSQTQQLKPAQLFLLAGIQLNFVSVL